MKHRSNLRGFTLIELMVVVVIIALLAALVIPALQMAQAHSMARNCLSRARSIAGAVSAYATAWEGWTNRDPDHYVKSFGYRLRSDRGYFGEDPGTWVSAQSSSGPLKAESESESYAQKGKDFRCQADPVPRLTRHAIPSSYHVYAAFAGKNVMGLSSASNRILVVREAHKRHPLDSDNMERHYVFADLHA